MRTRPLTLLLCLCSLLMGQTLLAAPRKGAAERTEAAPSTTARKRAPKAKESSAPKAPAGRTVGAGASQPGGAARRDMGGARAPGSSGSLAAADRAYTQKSFAAALTGYRKALAAKAVPDDRKTQVEFRVARCLAQTEQWDGATQEMIRFAGRNGGTAWEARAKSWLMQVYLMVPHEAWKVGDRFYRGDNVPELAEAAQPERVELQEEDERKALLYGEQAQQLWEKLRPGKGSSPEGADHAADLARVVSALRLREWAQGLQWRSPKDDAWQLDPAAPYDPAWAPPQKVLHLLLQAEAVGDASRKPLARLAQAVWLRGYHLAMGEIAVRRENGKEPVRLPYPYQDRTAQEVLRSLIKEFPEHPETEHAQLMAAQWMHQDGKLDEALAAYEAFLKASPAGKWADNAKLGIQSIIRSTLNVSTPDPQAPGKKVKLKVAAQNVPALKFSAYRVKLEELFRDPRVVSSTRSGVGDMLAQLGKSRGLRKFYQGDPVTWESTLSRPGDHRAVEAEVETPLSRVGAYVVEANGGPVRTTLLVVISDLALIQMVERDRVHAMVVNAATGAPVADATLVLREVYQFSKDGKEQRQVSAARLTSNADGLAEKPLAKERSSSPSVLTFAWKGERYALSGDTYAVNSLGGLGGFGGGRQNGKAYLYTDRAVYRPGQQVNFRALLTRKDVEGRLQVLKSTKAEVSIVKGEGTLLKQEMTTNEFGSLSGSYTLPAGARLGDYQLFVSTREEPAQITEFLDFFVEEYKKPEFEVTVEPGSGMTRVGDPLSAKIVVRYYFGAPVAGAKVRFTVDQEELFPRNPFAGQYDFLYSSLSNPEWERWNNSPHFRPEPEVPNKRVLEGSAVTNAQGELFLKIPTALNDPQLAGRHLRFGIRAEATDASRRTISGEGVARALATQFNSFVQVRKGFVNIGDRLQVDVRTLDADERPISVAGTARVLRLTPGEDGKPVTEEVYKAPLRTDAQGRAVFQWSADQDGHFEVRFEARDAWEQLVTGRAEAWIAGEAAGAGLLHNRHAALVPERSIYRLGEKARVLLTTDEPGSTVLLTYEGDNRILEKRVLRLNGRSTVLEIPITQRESPNVILAVTGIRNRELFSSQCTLYVPPAEELLEIQVSADKAVYRPGEEAVWRIRARDLDGRPVRTEASLGVVDTSLNYIQQANVQPIQHFLYAEERRSYVSRGASETSEVEALGEDDQPVVKFRPRAWDFSGGLGTFGTLASPQVDLPEEYFDFLGFSGAYEFRRFQVGGRYLTYGSVVVDEPENSGRIKHKAAPAAPPEEELGERPGRVEARETKEPRVKTNRLEANEGVTPRSNFADTAFWTPAVITGKDGEAVVRFRWPDNLTRWRATSRAWSATAQVGEATADVETTKDLLVRFQSPRFFTERDEVTLSANVHNYTDRDRPVRVRLELDGGLLAPAAEGSGGLPQPRTLDVPRADLIPGELSRGAASPGSAGQPGSGADTRVLETTVSVPKEGERRVDWRVRVARSGLVRLRVIADGGMGAEGPLSDAVEHQFPLLVHGVEKLVLKGGSLLSKGDDKSQVAKFTLELPAERAPGSGALMVRVSPSLAGSMLDALPYLVEYPYGCVEQTLDRFIPAVVCAKTLTDLGVDLSALRKRSQEEYQRLLLERPADRPENSAYTYPSDAPGQREVERMEREPWAWRAERSPVFNPAELDRVSRMGLDRLRQFQHADGGWGWWESDDSDPYITAFVLQGLVTGKASGLSVLAGMLEKGFAFLQARFKKETGRNNRVFQGYTLTLDPKRRAEAGAVLLAEVYSQREGLSPYGLALLAMALKSTNHAAEAKICLDNLENTAKVDAAAGTCSWPRSGSWWEWYRNPVETASTCLRAYLMIQPKHRLAPMVVRWLVNNRSGNAWDSTRETALAVQSLAEYVRQTGELAPEGNVTVEVAGKFKRTFTLSPEIALLGDQRLMVPASALTSGSIPVTLTRQGKGSLYYSASLRYFGLEEGITATGNEIRVRRRYYRLVKAQPGAKGTAEAPVGADGYQRFLLRQGERLTSGEELEAELLIESKNDYSYLVFEDMKPAGCEPVALRSGASYGDGLCSNMELRDEKVAFFVTRLPQGKRRLTYRLRAEVPGVFHAMPVNGYAMYAPEIRCVSDEGILGIEDAP